MKEGAYAMTTIYGDGRWATTVRSPEMSPDGQWVPDTVFELGHLKFTGGKTPLLTRKELRLTCVPAIAEAELQLYGTRQRARNAHRISSPDLGRTAVGGRGPLAPES